jgi:hypothetical protein
MALLVDRPVAGEEARVALDAFGRRDGLAGLPRRDERDADAQAGREDPLAGRAPQVAQPPGERFAEAVVSHRAILQ